MPTVAVGAGVLATRFAVPSGGAAAVLARLDADALGLARARIAARLGDPDPFHLRAALAAHPDASVEGCAGEALTPEGADAVLVAAGHAWEIAGLFAGRPPGASVRAVPMDDPARRYLRWAAEPAPPPVIGALETWTSAEIGDAPVATIRCAERVPGDGVALGSDYGLTLWRKGRFEAFPWPRGSRREARRVEAMTVHAGTLWVGTTQALYGWDFSRTVSSRRHGADADDGYDDLLSLLSAGGRLLLGYRTRFEGGRGPRDALAMCADPHGVVFAGTRDGALHVVDGGGPIRAFADPRAGAAGTPRPRPIRHLAFAAGALWVAAGGALHRFDGASWSAAGPEPTALATDARGRLWALAEGALHVLEDGALKRVPVALDRPWCLACVSGALWIGGRERVWRLGIR